jgi:tRNA1Val (adenine37-N6)-methyltransferase
VSGSPKPGLVRPARRPEGFVARGPAPRAPADILPRDGEDLCFLTGDWRIFQKRRGHRWSLDDLVTAWAAVRAVEGCEAARALDLGCGIGSVLQMVAWSLPRAQFVGIEAQPASAELARRSLAWNGADDRVRVLDGDLRDAAVLPGDARFDLITGTPPYFAEDEGVVSPVPQRGACRFELRGGVEAYCAAAARWLGPEGTFVLCAVAPQRERVFAAAASSRLCVWRWLDVVPKEGKAPLVGVAVLARREHPLVEERLTVRTADGQWTPQFRALRTEMGMPDRPARR